MKNHDNTSIWLKLSVFRISYHVLPCFKVFIRFSGKKLEKVFDFVKNQENSSIWLKLAVFQTSYHVLRFSSGFQQRSTRKCMILRKPRKFIELAKISNFSYKLPCFNVFIRSSAKSCKKLCDFVNHENSLIWPKLSKFGRNYYLLDFYQVFSKTLLQSV